MQTWSANQLRNRWLPGWLAGMAQVDASSESREPRQGLLVAATSCEPSRAVQCRARQRRGEQMRCEVAGWAAGINKID